MMDNRKKRRNYLIATIILVGVIVFAAMYYTDLATQTNQSNLISFSEKVTQDRNNFMVFFFFALICGLIANFTLGRYKKLNTGIKGEEKTQKLLSTLPESYIISSNVPLIYEGKKAEIDNLIISEKGIIIVETKNYKGRISGSADSPTWTQVKYSRGGNRYKKELRNPIKQANRQTWILSQILKSHGIHCWIDCLVYLQQAQCDFKDKKLFTNPYEMIDYIQALGKPNALSKEDIEKIQSILATLKEPINPQ